jgi:hypothetical protein
LPGLIPDLIEAGAEDYDAIADVQWFSPAGLCPRFPSDLRMLGATRDLIDWGVRRQLQGDPRILIYDGALVAGIRLDRGTGRVTGVVITDRETDRSEDLDADLVVDAAGRGSRSPQWLEDHGYARPEKTVVDGFLGYASQLVK